jgi:hypothetical protein
VILGLILIAGVSATSDADEANAAYTRCLFASSREASAAQLSVSAFEARLETACDAEQAELERAAARIFASRGEANASARAKRMTVDARRMVVDSYRRTQELEPKLRDVAALCKAHPDQCRD